MRPTNIYLLTLVLTLITFRLFSQDRMNSEMTLVDSPSIATLSGRFYIVSKYNDEYLSLGKMHSFLITKEKSVSNQIWYFFKSTDRKRPNCVHIQSISPPQSVIDVQGNNKDVDCPIISWPFHGEENQNWKLVSTNDNDGSFYIISDASQKCIEISQKTVTPNYTYLVQNFIKGFDYQKWFLISIDSNFTNIEHVKKEVKNSLKDSLHTQKVKATKLDNIYFNTSEFELLPDSEKKLDTLISILNNNREFRLIIYGHTDNTGKPNYNQQLSLRRAKCVYDHLIQKGINEKRLSYQGFGSSKPTSTNKTDTGRSNNRRVEFITQNFFLQKKG